MNYLTVRQKSNSCILEFIGGENDIVKRESDAAPGCDFLKLTKIASNLG